MTRPGRMTTVFGRYVVPLSVVPLTRATVGRLVRAVTAGLRGDGSAPAPPTLAVEIVSPDAAMAFDAFVRLHDDARPLLLTLSGRPDVLTHDELPAFVEHASVAGARVALVTDGARLDAGRTHALIRAGLARVEVTLDASEPAASARGDLERVLRNLEKLIAMRDANRAPGPRVEPRLVLSRDNADQAPGIVALCAARLRDVQPSVVLGSSDDGVAPIPFGDAAALASLRSARAAAVSLGFRRTVASLDAAILGLGHDVGRAPCLVPWTSGFVAAGGSIHPCARQARATGGLGVEAGAPFGGAWNRPDLRAFRARVHGRRGDDPVCGACRHEDSALERLFGAIARAAPPGGA